MGLRQDRDPVDQSVEGQEKLRSTSLRLDVIEVEKSALTRELQSARDEVNAIRSRAEEGNARLAELLDLLRDRLPPEASHSKPSGRRPRTSPRRRS